VFAAVKTTVSGFDCVKFLCHFNWFCFLQLNH
jgi:hypothetical protein